MSNRSVILDMWKDHTEPPVIVWVNDGYWQRVPVAVDDSHEADVYQEYAAAFYAAKAYRTFDEVCEEWKEDLTPEEIDELYQWGDGREARRGLPASWYVEGADSDGSDAIIYVDEETSANSNRESLIEAARYIDGEEVADIYESILEARRY